MAKNITIGVLALALILSLGVRLGLNLGATSGPEHYNAEYFYNTLTATGRILFDGLKQGVATQSGSATTTAITAANFCDKGVIQWTPSVANASATLPTAATLQADCLDEWGSSQWVYFENLSNAASSTLFILGDASSTIEYLASSTADQVLPGGDGAKIEAIHSTSTTSNSAMVKFKIYIFED